MNIKSIEIMCTRRGVRRTASIVGPSPAPLCRTKNELKSHPGPRRRARRLAWGSGVWLWRLGGHTAELSLQLYCYMIVVARGILGRGHLYRTAVL